MILPEGDVYGRSPGQTALAAIRVMTALDPTIRAAAYARHVEARLGMTQTTLTPGAAHSPLGASSAKRWMQCPGSIGLLKLLDGDGEGDDPQYRTDGTTAHSGLAHCLENGVEPWEIVGREFDGHKFTQDMCDAVGVFLSVTQASRAAAEQTFVERKMHGSLHPAMMGTVDLGLLLDDGKIAEIVDFKHGAGVRVAVKNNPQLLYYAYLLLEHPDFALVQEIRLQIIQPRAFNPDSEKPWTVTADFVREWGRDVLLPAMLQTEQDGHLQVGEHCRFCPARLVCPAQEGVFEALIRAKPEDAYRLADAALEQNYELIPVAKMYLKALEDEMMRRAMLGAKFYKNKLVNKTGDRVWKPEAEIILVGKFGEKNVYAPRKLASPAVIEKLGPEAQTEVKKLAFTPQNGYTLVEMSSKKPAVHVQPASQTFAADAQKILGEQEEEW